MLIFRKFIKFWIWHIFTFFWLDKYKKSYEHLKFDGFRDFFGIFWSRHFEVTGSRFRKYSKWLKGEFPNRISEKPKIIKLQIYRSRWLFIKKSSKIVRLKALDLCFQVFAITSISRPSPSIYEHILAKQQNSKIIF